MYGTSQNAVYNQLYIALITHCLLVILQICMDQKNNLLQIYKYIRFYWHKSFSTFLKATSKDPRKHLKGRGEPLATQRIFEETLRQYEDDDTQHLDLMDYDPVIA